MQKHHILIVDDEDFSLSYLADVLALDSYAIDTAVSGIEAIELLKKHDYDLMLTDLMMPVMNGLQLLEKSRKIRPHTAVVLVTAYGSLRSAIEAMRLGAIDYILKPIDEDELRIRVRNALENRNVRMECDIRTRELESLIFAISHDLAGHIVALRGFTRRLRGRYSGMLPAEATSYLGRMDSSAEMMERLVGAISDYARLGKSGMIRHEEVDLNEVVKEVLQNSLNLIDERNAEIIVANHLPLINTEWVRAYQVFHNLISNAIKFAKEGVPPVVEIGYEEKNESHQFYVKDKGVGISESDQERIFEMFGRGGDRRRVSGTGLGLAIVKKIINQAGGSIWVESEEGVGTTFFFTFPKHAVHAEEPQPSGTYAEMP